MPSKKEPIDVESIVEDIKVSWRWCWTKLEILTCLYHEWSWNPNECLLRQHFVWELSSAEGGSILFRSLTIGVVVVVVVGIFLSRVWGFFFFTFVLLVCAAVVNCGSSCCYFRTAAVGVLSGTSDCSYLGVDYEAVVCVNG